METIYFTNRATVRNFRQEAPSESLIESILEKASHAPNTGNMQLYSVIETRDEAKLAELRPFHFSQPASMAPVLLTVCADVNRFERWCAVSDAEPEFRNLQGLTAALIDATIFAQQIITIAEMEGLGTCWLGTTTYNAPEIAKALKLPKGVVPAGTIAIGYPASEAKPCERLPLKAIAFKESYPEWSDEEVKKLHAEKESLPENRLFVEENGKQTLAQVFTEVRYPASTSEPFSEKFRQYLADAGFRL